MGAYGGVGVGQFANFNHCCMVSWECLVYHCQCRILDSINLWSIPGGLFLCCINILCSWFYLRHYHLALQLYSSYWLKQLYSQVHNGISVFLNYCKFLFFRRQKCHKLSKWAYWLPGVSPGIKMFVQRVGIDLPTVLPLRFIYTRWDAPCQISLWMCLCPGCSILHFL